MSMNHKRLNKRMLALTRFIAFERDGFRCVRCVAEGRGGAGKLEGHHKVGLDNGGSPYDPANVETLCRDCHILQSISPMRREWARYLKHTYKQLGA